MAAVFETDDVYLLPNDIKIYEGIPAKISFPPSTFTSAEAPYSINQSTQYYVTIKYNDNSSGSPKWKFLVSSESNSGGSPFVSDLYDDSNSEYKYNKLVISASSTPRPDFLK